MNGRAFDKVTNDNGNSVKTEHRVRYSTINSAFQKSLVNHNSSEIWISHPSIKLQFASKIPVRANTLLSSF